MAGNMAAEAVTYALHLSFQTLANMAWYMYMAYNDSFYCEIEVAESVLISFWC